MNIHDKFKTIKNTNMNNVNSRFNNIMYASYGAIALGYVIRDFVIGAFSFTKNILFKDKNQKDYTLRENIETLSPIMQNMLSNNMKGKKYKNENALYKKNKKKYGKSYAKAVRKENRFYFDGPFSKIKISKSLRQLILFLQIKNPTPIESIVFLYIQIITAIREIQDNNKRIYKKNKKKQKKKEKEIYTSSLEMVKHNDISRNDLWAITNIMNGIDQGLKLSTETVNTPINMEYMKTISKELNANDEELFKFIQAHRREFNIDMY